MSKVVEVGQVYEADYLPTGYEDTIDKPFELRVKILSKDIEGNYEWEVISEDIHIIIEAGFDEAAAKELSVGFVGTYYGGIKFVHNKLQLG